MTLTEENYLKALYTLSLHTEEVQVKDIAAQLQIRMPTVTSMVKKLGDKKLVKYEKYKAIELTEKGRKQALYILRKHRLTELFLSQVMNLGWEEVHDIAEQIEHIESELFFNRIDEMLGHPKFDPHGEPIPDAQGKLPVSKSLLLCEGTAGKKYRLVGVVNNETALLKFLNSIHLAIGSQIEVKDIQDFDRSMTVILNDKNSTMFSYTICRSLLVA